MICIYMITNTITNERYIGQTRDYQRRLWQHKSAAKNGSYLKISKAIAKYGIDPSGITSVLKGRQRKAGGYKWLYQL